MPDRHSTSRRWRTVRRMAYERDRAAGATCWICGGPIDYDAPAHSPDAWEPDHVIPVCDHPEWQMDLANIRPSHSACNRRRGAQDMQRRRAAERIGQTSRQWL